MKMIKFPSIDQFRTVVKNVQDHASYVGKDEDGNPIFDYLKPKPTLRFYGTVKLHGTNAALCYNAIDGFWVQSRENIITPEKDNMGCAFFCEQNKLAWMKIITELSQEYDIDLSKSTISIYFEWVGKGIQKGVGISEIEKSAFIFYRFKVSPIEPDRASEDERAIWLPTCTEGGQRIFNVSESSARIYNVCNFKTYSIEIDFNDPARSQNILNDLTLEVEEECPISKAFGISGIGEGIVWEAIWNNCKYTFKVKGEKHSNSKVKTLKVVDTEKLDKIDKCVEEICHTWRFEQALREVFGPDYEQAIDRKRMSEYLKWISLDTLKEESDIIVSYGFEPKDVMGKVQGKAKEYFYQVESL